MSKTKSQQIIRFAIAAVVVLVLAAIGYRLYQIHQEKSDFAKAESSISTLAQQIEAKIGKPDDTKTEKSCDRPNVKFETGTLSCSTSINMLYGAEDAVKATSLMSSVSSLSNEKLRASSVAATGTGFINSPPQKGEQIFYQTFAANSPLSCVISYTYDNNKPTQGLRIDAGCSKQTIKQLYPLHD